MSCPFPFPQDMSPSAASWHYNVGAHHIDHWSCCLNMGHHHIKVTHNHLSLGHCSLSLGHPPVLMGCQHINQEHHQPNLRYHHHDLGHHQPDMGHCYPNMENDHLSTKPHCFNLGHHNLSLWFYPLTLEPCDQNLGANTSTRGTVSSAWGPTASQSGAYDLN